MSDWNSVLVIAWNTIALGLCVALFAGAAGLLLAWFVSRTDVWGRETLASVLSMPYAVPPYLLGIAWVILGNPTVGLLKDWMPEQGMYGFMGMTFVLASVAFAYPYLELRAGFERLDSALEEAARVSGAKPWRVFRDVSLPLLWPSLLNGMCLAFLFSISAFGVPALLGGPVRTYVFTTLIYTQLRMGGADGLKSGLLLSALLAGLAVLALVASSALNSMQRKKSGPISGAKSSRHALVRLGNDRFQSGRVAASAFAWGFFIVCVLLPWAALGLASLAPVAGHFAPSEWTLRNITRVIGMADFHEAMRNSLMLTATSASLIVAGGFMLAFLAERRSNRAARWLIQTLGVPFATPGTVLAILILFVGTLLSRLGLPADSPLLLMGISYCLKYAAVAARSLQNAFRQVHPALEEAARVSGARTPALIRTIWIPLLKKSMRASWLLAALPILTELTMSVLLTGPGGATLGTLLFQLQEYADQSSAAALAWILLTLALVVGFLTRERKSAPAFTKTQGDHA